MKTKNNLSKIECVNFCQMYQYKKIGKTNKIIDLSGEQFNFCLILSVDDISCRQYSKKSKGIIFRVGHKYYKIQKNNLVVGTVTRISPDGEKYFNVTSNLKYAKEI